ncbi:hypothetical protein DFP72DRAFT_873509, partial [Ephemerocybe angulata]
MLEYLGQYDSTRCGSQSPIISICASPSQKHNTSPAFLDTPFHDIFSGDGSVTQGLLFLYLSPQVFLLIVLFPPIMTSHDHKLWSMRPRCSSFIEGTPALPFISPSRITANIRRLVLRSSISLVQNNKLRCARHYTNITPRRPPVGPSRALKNRALWCLTSCDEIRPFPAPASDPQRMANARLKPFFCQPSCQIITPSLPLTYIRRTYSNFKDAALHLGYILALASLT